MAVVDPFFSLRDWRISLYRGDSAAIDRFLDAIDQKLPTGWARDLEQERVLYRPERTRCHLFDSEGDAAVRVWLHRETETRVRGCPVQVLRHLPSGDTSRIWRLVSEFAEGCVLPAAHAAGVRCTRPAFGPRSAVTPDAESLLTQLADSADGAWPLTGVAQMLWDELVSIGLAGQIAIDRAELCQWLADSGWEQEAVAAIADRFFADSEWLARRLAVMAP